jgi:hypothetical protein
MAPFAFSIEMSLENKYYILQELETEWIER